MPLTRYHWTSIADNNGVEQWESEWGLDSAKRAKSLWNETLARYEAPSIDEGGDQALRAFIAQRKGTWPGTSY